MHTQDFTLTLTASQADTLEDALLTFAPQTALTIHPSGAGSFDAHLPIEALPVAVAALESYTAQITPKGRTAPRLVTLLQKVGQA